MKDIAFRPDVLTSWVEAFPGALVRKLHGIGHFVALEATEELLDALDQA